MRTSKFIILLTILSMGLQSFAQNKEKKYAFAVYISNGTATSDCVNINQAYVSPIVSSNFGDWRDEENAIPDLEMKWAKKCEAKFNIRETWCFSDNYGPAVWEKNYGKVDEERDTMISDLQRQGYTVSESYIFSFYYNYNPN
ncbi:hypothetical protein [Gaetbulibacter aestuarii]|uniref:Uncharacterized protein n=1 Tax=Gaetbulibacter aestuarii TaxID=1502358 RepID=A0ABW7MV15_9FLAO